MVIPLAAALTGVIAPLRVMLKLLVELGDEELEVEFKDCGVDESDCIDDDENVDDDDDDSDAEVDDEEDDCN